MSEGRLWVGGSPCGWRSSRPGPRSRAAEAGRVYRVTAGMLPDIESLVGAGWAEWCGEDGFRARGGGSLADRADAERTRREDAD